MKKLLSILLSFIMMITCMTLPSAAFASANDKSAMQSDSGLRYKEGEVIAVLKSQTSQKYFSSRNISALFGSSVKLDTSSLMAGSNSTLFSSNSVKVAAFKSSSLSTKQLINKLEKDDNVLYALPNYILKAADITKDTYSKYQWALQNNGYNGGTKDKDVNPESLWEKVASSDEEQIVAVCDTGIDYTHEDLKDSLWVNPYGGKLVGKYGYDFTGTVKDNSPLDDNGHGTHVAGIIAGQADNQKGISGINKNNVKIMSLKWLDASGEGDTETIIATYDYIRRAIKLGANVVAINNSWGGMADTATQNLFDSIFDEFGKLGVVSAIAAGNDAMDIELNEELLPIFDEDMINIPASTKSDYALVVGATNEKDNLASFSSYSKKYVDISAPGTDILSSVSYDCFNPSIYDDQQISKLCKNYQNFEGEFTSSSFGYPEVIDNYEYDGKKYVTNASVSLTDDGFGYSGKALKFTTNDKPDKQELPLYYFSIPYTLDDADKNYSVSFQIRASEDVRVSVFDAPDGVSAVQAADAYDSLIYLDGYTGNDYWTHMVSDFDIKSLSESESYQKSAQRQLVFEILAPDINTEVSIDDLAVSNQDIDTADFGKYDFYNGTSMATPYVAGAVALASNAYPDASILDVINIVKNTGRVNSALEKYTENSRVLSLDNSQNTPPIISSAAYDKSGRVEINGSFNQITAVKVNGTVVQPTSTSKSKIVIPDNNYSTKKLIIVVENAFGSDSESTIISNKKSYPELMNEESAVPAGNNIIVPAGDTAYIVSSEGIFDMNVMPSIEDENKLSAYYDLCALPDYTKLFDEVSAVDITSAVYMNNKIYFIAENSIYASNSAVIGYDKVFGYIDLEKESTVKLCDIPCDKMTGQSLAVFNGNIYMLGGYDAEEKAFSKDFYKYNSSKKSFENTAYALPQGRAYAKTIQYRNKLYVVYGADSTEKMPKIIIFDGSKWSESKVSFDSDDYTTVKDINIYNGNIGYSANGLYCVGSYVYSLGDSFNYNAQNDSVTASAYCGKESIGKGDICGTTIFGMFIGYGSVQGDALDDYASKSYALEMVTDFAFVEPADSLLDAPVNLDFGESYAHMYGDKVTVTAIPDSGYIVTGIKVGSKTYPVNSKGSADIILTAPTTVIDVTYKKVAPNKVTNLKVSAVSSNGYTISWSKPARAAGYYVQQYKNKKWTTIATINNANTTKLKISKASAGTNQYRVRAFSNYNSKKYNGAYSSTLKVYVPAKQKIKSVKAVSKGFNVTYTKNKYASGYEIQYAANKKFSKAKTVNVKGNSTVSKKVTKLSAKKTYYVRVRSYKTVNGKKIYGAWSAAKQIKTKK